MAGAGTRLKPLTDDRPKGLVEVAGEPLLSHVFGALPARSLSGVIVVIGTDGQAIVDRYGHTWHELPLTYVQQRDPRGLADAVLAAAPHITADFAVFNGDNVHRSNLETVITQHQSSDATATLLVESVSRTDAKTTGVCELDEAGHVASVVEKPDQPPTTLAMAGFGVFNPALLSACRLIMPSDRGEYELADAITLLCQAGRLVETVRLDGWRVNVNTPADIETVEQRLATD